MERCAMPYEVFLLYVATSVTQKYLIRRMSQQCVPMLKTQKTLDSDYPSFAHAFDCFNGCYTLHIVWNLKDFKYLKIISRFLTNENDLEEISPEDGFNCRYS